MSRLDDIIPENEDKLAWLLGVPRDTYFRYHDKVYKADDIILQAMWTADGEFYFEEIEQREAFDIIQHSNEIETPLMWDAADAKHAKSLIDIFSPYHHLYRAKGTVYICQPSGDVCSVIWSDDLFSKLPLGEWCKICLNGIKECYEVPHIRDSALTTSGSGDGHADPVGAPGTEGPSGAGPLNPLYKNDISNLH